MVKLFESPNITELDNNNEYDYQSGDVVSNAYHDYQSDPTDVDYMSSTEYDDIMEVPYDNSSSIYNNSNTNNISFDSDNQDDVTELPYEDEEDPEDVLNEGRKSDLFAIAKALVNTNDRAEIRTNIESLRKLDYDIYKMAIKMLNKGDKSIYYVAGYISDYITQIVHNESKSAKHCKESKGIPFLVTYGWSEGNPEDGTYFDSDSAIIYANSEEEACMKWNNEYGYSVGRYEGCHARKATPEEVKNWEDRMKDLDDYPRFNNTSYETEETNPSSIGHYKRSTIGDKEDVCPECGESECICDECNSITESAYKRIARYNEFDNGHVIFHYEEMSDEEAEDLAKQASIDNPNDVYYVKYDDIMNPCSDIRWYRGKEYNYKDITCKDGKYQPSTNEDCKIIEEDYSDDSEDYESEYTEWTFLDTKSVPDADGFINDYSLWYNKSTGQYVCILGDTDIYYPENSEPDFECDDRDEAYEWFDSYEGLLDDDDEDDGLYDEVEY